jgi:hypothetical protein
VNFRDRINAVLHGDQPDQVPFAPYDDLVPRGDFERVLRNRGMGLCLRCSGIFSETPGLRLETQTHNGIRRTTHHTPVGTVHSARNVRVGRIVDGGSIECEWPIKDLADFDPIIYVIENTTYHADYQRFHDMERDVGVDGIVRFEGPVSPYESSYWEGSGAYFSLEDWVAAQVDHPHEFSRLMAALEARVQRIIPLALDAPGGFLSMGWLGGVFGPRQFADHVLPFYQQYVPQFEAAGKLCALHADATNLSIFADLVAQTGVQVVEAFTPPPVGDLSLSDARAAWGPNTIIWVNFPETIFWSGRDATYDYTTDLLKQDKDSQRLVIGMTEMGSYGITDDETERFFKDGMLAVMDAIADHGTY